MNLQRILGIHAFSSGSGDNFTTYNWKLDSLAFELSQGMFNKDTISGMMKTAIGVGNTRFDRVIGLPFGSWGLASITQKTQSNGNDYEQAISFVPAVKADVIAYEHRKRGVRRSPGKSTEPQPYMSLTGGFSILLV